MATSSEAEGLRSRIAEQVHAAEVMMRIRTGGDEWRHWTSVTNDKGSCLVLAEYPRSPDRLTIEGYDVDLDRPAVEALRDRLSLWLETGRLHKETQA